MEARPVVQLIFQLRFLCGAALAARSGHTQFAGPVLSCALGWLASIWAVYTLNGIADIVGDRANGSRRPIARGLLPAREAKVVVVTLATTGLLASAAASMVNLLLVGVTLVIGCAYSIGPRPLKNSMTGFFASVTALGLLTYLSGWYSSRTGSPNAELLVFGTAMSLWMGLGGTTKDLSDTEGDRLSGRRTWPVLLGERRAKRLMATAAVFVGTSFLLASLLWVPELAMEASAVHAGSIVLAWVACSSASVGNRTARRRPYRVFMTTQYVVHLVLVSQLALGMDNDTLLEGVNKLGSQAGVGEVDSALPFALTTHLLGVGQPGGM